MGRLEMYRVIRGYPTSVKLKTYVKGETPWSALKFAGVVPFLDSQARQIPQYKS
jgi:hypothetical protein